MVDTVTTQTLLDGDRLVIQKFTNISDGTGETNVVKVNVSALTPNSYGVACTGLKLNRVWSSAHGMEVRILWEATTPVMAWMVPQNTTYYMHFGEHFGGIPNNAAATGKTGNITFTTSDASVGDMYTIVLECIKVYG
jgi:hypothetical protein